MKDARTHQPFGGGEQIGLIKPLVDQTTQPLRTAISGDGHAFEIGGGQQLQGALGDAISPQRRKGQRTTVLLQVSSNAVDRLLANHLHA